MNKDKNQIKSQITKISFSLMSKQDIENLSVHTLTSKDLYDLVSKTPMADGPLDRRLGVGNKKDTCLTCGENIINCVGHFGDIKLILPVFHIGLIKQTLNVLTCVCKTCGKVLLSESKKIFYKDKIRESLNKTEFIHIQRKIIIECRKMTNCIYCNSLNGTIKKGAGFKILHEVEVVELSNSDKEKISYRSTTESSGFDLGFVVENRSTINAKLRRDKKNLVKHIEEINPLIAYNIFSLVEESDFEFLGLEDSPEKFIIRNVVVPPACIRPSVGLTEKDSTNEDDITIKIAEIIHTNYTLRDSIEKGNPVNIINDDWDHLQLQCALLINSDLPQVNVQSQPIKGIIQRLKGKGGRFRCNLSGKRVDFSGRTVISPNPNLSIDQVDVPEYMAKILTIPEKVTKFNKNKLQKLVSNGPLNYPGANYILGKSFKKYLLYGNKNEELKEGEIVERHIMNGDIVLFNRQPSLHRMSIMAHYVNIHKNKTLRFNECVCAPYNADFDGDEMNIHVPQTIEAMAECIELMGVNENIVTPRHGEPLIAATQDFITALYMLTSKDTFFDRQKFGQLLSYFCQSRILIDPVIVKPVELFTGKQLLEAMIFDCLNEKRLINEIVLKAKNRSFIDKWHFNDSYVVFQRGRYLFGRIDKNIIGGESKKNSILYILLKIEKNSSSRMMYNITKVSSRYLGEMGFSIGIRDVLPSTILTEKKKKLVNSGYDKCKDVIEKMSQTNMENAEMEISHTLNKIREECGSICINELSFHNSPIIMQACGSKGSKINVSQMIACVGQQIISGKRIPNGMLDRTLPLFEKFSITPEAKGFVENSFFTGMKPAEFFFHAVSGREGLVDTAVKTAETGYMQRRLMKALEDLSVSYDYTVRSTSEIIQFKYGEDNIDPLTVESEEFVDLEKLFDKVEANLFFKEYKIFCKLLTKEKLLEKIQNKFNELKNEHFIKKYCCNIFNKKFIENVFNFFLQKLDFTKFFKGKFYKILQFDEFYDHFFKSLKEKVCCSIIQPGTAVGAIAGQSIGEPGTQMTLKTFHFAGVASMNITLGVPRLKEIINAVSNINTPIINLALTKTDLLSAQIVKGKILKVYFKDICTNVTETVSKEIYWLDFKIDTNLINKLRLQIDLLGIKHKLNLTEQSSIVNNDIIRITLKNTINQNIFNIQKLKKKIMNTIINGISTVSKVIIHNDKGVHKVICEGFGLQKMLGLRGVDFSISSGNGILETQEVLGIEAARALIINEIEYVVGKHGIKIDPRHIMLLADTMTYKGEVLGITRFGISKMSCSTLMLASFEQTSDHLFDAAIKSKEDPVIGVSESIILGKPISIGTGSVELYWNDP